MTWASDRSLAGGEIVNSDILRAGATVSVVLVPNANSPATADSSLSLNNVIAGWDGGSVEGSSADQIGSSERDSDSVCLPASELAGSWRDG